MISVFDCVMSEYHFERSEPTKGEESLPMMLRVLMFVLSGTCGESKCGAVLITESTAVMNNDITEETSGYFDKSTSFTDDYYFSHDVAKIGSLSQCGLLYTSIEIKSCITLTYSIHC